MNSDWLLTKSGRFLCVRVADISLKQKEPAIAREWIHVMEEKGHPSCEHFVQRLKRIVGSKDKHLLDTLAHDNRGNRNRKGLGVRRSRP